MKTRGLLVIALLLLGCGDLTDKVLDSNYTGHLYEIWVHDNSGEFQESEIKLKHGFIDSLGNVIIKPTYSLAREFFGNVTIARDDNGIIKIINRQNKIVKEVGDSNINIGEFHEGMAIYLNIALSVNGYIDSTGRFLNRTFDSYNDRPGDFSEGLAAVKINGKYGYIDKGENVIIDPIYDDAFGFSEGLAVVKSGDYYSFIDHKGNIISKDRFEDANSFSDGLAGIVIRGEVKYVNKEMKVVIDNGLGYFIRATNNRSGKPQAMSFSEGLAEFTENGLIGFFDKTGNVVIPPRFSDTGEFREGLCNVKSEFGEEWGYIDKMGNVVIPYSYRSAYPFSRGLARVNPTTNTLAYINRKGQTVWTNE